MSAKLEIKHIHSQASKDIYYRVNPKEPFGALKKVAFRGGILFTLGIGVLAVGHVIFGTQVGEMFPPPTPLKK